jgi:hypothetical protein
MFSDDWLSTGVSFCYASFNMAELFYTNNGVPIEEDKYWNYVGRHELRTSTEEAENGMYIPIGQETVSLHFDREPRFYANLGFDRGYYELSTTVTENSFGASYDRYLRLRMGEPGYWQFNTGYFVKKLVAYETSCSQGNINNNYSPRDYRFPLIRLADLYLMYSEALNEVKDAPDDEVYEWIDKVRAVVGLKGVVESWENSRYPNRPKEKKEMREIIRQERMIELAFEGQRFWDVRRWKTAEKEWTKRPKGWNGAGTTAAEYYTAVNMDEARKFSYRDYLWPISTYDLSRNTNLEQTYGW